MCLQCTTVTHVLGKAVLKIVVRWIVVTEIHFLKWVKVANSIVNLEFHFQEEMQTFTAMNRWNLE